MWEDLHYLNSRLSTKLQLRNQHGSGLRAGIYRLMEQKEVQKKTIYLSIDFNKDFQERINKEGNSVDKRQSFQ